MKTFNVVWVSLYLFLVGLLLVLNNRIQAQGLKKVIKSLFRSKFNSKIIDFVKEIGFCWKVSLPDFLCNDFDSASRISVYENGVNIGVPHSGHDDIRNIGLGRYSHWGSELYFSTPDNSNPNTNGRVYEVREI